MTKKNHVKPDKNKKGLGLDTLLDILNHTSSSYKQTDSFPGGATVNVAAEEGDRVVTCRRKCGQHATSTVGSRWMRHHTRGGWREWSVAYDSLGYQLRCCFVK